MSKPSLVDFFKTFVFLVACACAINSCSAQVLEQENTSQKALSSRDFHSLIIENDATRILSLAINYGGRSPNTFLESQLYQNTESILADFLQRDVRPTVNRFSDEPSDSTGEVFKLSPDMFGKDCSAKFENQDCIHVDQYLADIFASERTSTHDYDQIQIRFTPGRYYFHNEVYVPSNVHIAGTDVDLGPAILSRLNYKDAGPNAGIFVLAGSRSTAASHIVISDLNFRDGRRAVSIRNADSITIARLTLENRSQIQAINVDSLYFTDNVLLDPQYSTSLEISATAGLFSRDIVIRNSLFGGSINEAIDFDGTILRARVSGNIFLAKAVRAGIHVDTLAEEVVDVGSSNTQGTIPSDEITITSNFFGCFGRYVSGVRVKLNSDRIDISNNKFVNCSVTPENAVFAVISQEPGLYKSRLAAALPKTQGTADISLVGAGAVSATGNEHFGSGAVLSLRNYFKANTKLIFRDNKINKAQRFFDLASVDESTLKEVIGDVEISGNELAFVSQGLTEHIVLRQVYNSSNTIERNACDGSTFIRIDVVEPSDGFTAYPVCD